MIERQDVGNIAWQTIVPNAQHTWLTEGLHAEFETFMPMGTKGAKAEKSEVDSVIFQTYSTGISTGRDAWVCNFNQNILSESASKMIENYNAEVARWTQRTDRDANVDNFVISDDAKIKWSRDLKAKLKRGRTTKYDEHKIATSLYRPFTKSNLYFDRMMNDRASVLLSIFPTLEAESENWVICLTDKGSEKPFMVLMSQHLTDRKLVGSGCGTQCFAFYIYEEDGTNRRENITDWALTEFRTHYNDDTITKWDIFHYTYGLLHHPEYREKYEANLKRDLPHIPFAENFWGFVEAGKRLAELHVNYESQPEYDKLERIQTPPLNWRVEKMKLSKDKTALIYNDFLTLSGIPSKVFDYQLGTRSALEWIIDQYRIKTDKRSGIVNNPNRADDPQYIVKLIGKVITVSLETVNIINTLPPLK